MSEIGARAARAARQLRTLRTPVGVPPSALAVLLALASAPVCAELRVEGVDSGTEAVIEAFLTIDELPCDAPRWWVERRHRQAPDEIRRAMETLGYYRAGQTGRLDWQDDCWQATYQIEPGDPVRIQTAGVVLEGGLGEEPRMRDALAALEIAPEEPFSHSAYEAAKTQLLEAATSLGYLDAQFSRHRVEVDPDANLAAIDLTLAGGERYRIGEIVLEQRALKEKLFRRFLRFEEGDYYDSDDLAETYRDLLESDFYDRVLVSPDLDRRENGTVPVQVVASALTRRSTLVGAGYATDTGPRGRLDLRYRRINDRGHRANVHTLVSAVNGEGRAEYRVPYGDPTHEWLFVNGEIVYEDTETSESLKRTLGGGRTHRRGRKWVETNYLEYSTESFEVADQDGRSQLLLLGTSWARTTSIDAPRPRRGYSLGFNVRGASETLLSDNDLLQIIFQGRHILALGERLRLLSRVRAGWTWQDDFDDLPPSVRFFAGGDNSVRGYGYESLGPEEDGEVVGGKRLLTGSLELDALVRQNWSVAAFIDSGSAFDATPDFFTGVGLGVRWYSPLGPLRVDIAHPLDDPDRSVRLHVSLGPDL